MKKNIYMDNAADTVISRPALDKLNEILTSGARNSSSLHLNGRIAAGYLEEARDIVAASIGASAHEVIFTSGGTEADNIALIGYAFANRNRGNHIISTNVEHPAVLKSLKYLEECGFEVTYLKVNENCLIDSFELESAIKKDTILVSIMYVNNETGAINDIRKLSDIAHSHGVAFMSDCVQAYTKIDMDVNDLGIDLMSASSHKFHGPNGAGFLYVRNGIKMTSFIHGGNQERKLRSGTVPVALVRSMAEAVIDAESHKEDRSRIKKERDLLFEAVKSANGAVTVNGSMENRIYDNICLSFPDIAADSFLYALDDAGLSASAGSACEAGSLQISHVIKAIGHEDIGAPLRLTLSRYTTHDEIIKAAEIINKVYSEHKKK